MSTSTLLKDFAIYNLWANRRICNALEQCSQSQFYKKNNTSFGSIAHTVYHICIADKIWLGRLTSQNLPEIIPFEEYSQFSLIAKLLSESEALKTAIVSFSQLEMDAVMSYSNLEGKKFHTRREHMIQHCINHATFHRGQLISMLRDSKIRNFESLDFIHYISELKNHS